MSILDEVETNVNNSLVMTIVGVPGSGKTSLACTFDNPVLISTRGESVPRDVAKVPHVLKKPETSQDVIDKLAALYKEDHNFKTVIIDSVTGLEQMFIDEVLKSDPRAKSINQALGGYGSGMNAVAALHGRVRKGAERLCNDRGMNVIFIGHADVSRFDPPDSEGFNQYTVRLSNKSMFHYVDSVDLVGFLHQETILKEVDGQRKMAVTSGNIIMTCTLNPAYGITKNRLGITHDIIVEKNVNPLADYLLQE